MKSQRNSDIPSNEKKNKKKHISNSTHHNAQQWHTTESYSSNTNHEDKLEGFTGLLLTDLAVNSEFLCKSSLVVRVIGSQDVVEDITLFTLLAESFASANNWLRGLKSMMGDEDDMCGCLSLFTAFSLLFS